MRFVSWHYQVNVSWILIAWLCSSSILAAQSDAAPATADALEPKVVQLEGWTVRVGPQLKEPAYQAKREEYLEALRNHLQRIRYIVPGERLRELQTLPIWIDLEHPLENMQYHPSRQWLTQNGYDPRLEKHVHIPRADQLVDPSTWSKHPYVVLHELAHAYHDQVLSWEQPDIKAAYEAAKASGGYERVLDHTGRTVRHYGLSNHKEYFAEATEAYFGVNDFFPFVRAELKQHDPRMFETLRKIWGDL